MFLKCLYIKLGPQLGTIGKYWKLNRWGLRGWLRSLKVCLRAGCGTLISPLSVYWLPWGAFCATTSPCHHLLHHRPLLTRYWNLPLKTKQGKTSFYVCMPTCLNACVPALCVQVAMETWRGHRVVSCLMWVLGTKLHSSIRAAKQS